MHFGNFLSILVLFFDFVIFISGDRGYVFYEESPHSCKSSLNIEPVFIDDVGQYRCRVDYDTSPTRNTRIKLKLVGMVSFEKSLNFIILENAMTALVK